MQESEISIVVADDEVNVQNLIIAYLSSFSPQIRIMGQAGSGKETMELVRQFKPTVVFLDVNMPDMDGMSAGAQIKSEYPDTFIIFVTAHTKYAADAYQMEAVDYLVKPLTKQAVHRAVKKVALLQQMTVNEMNNNKQLVFKHGHEMYFLNADGIIFFEKRERKTIIHTLQGLYKTNETLNFLEKRIPGVFFRCHKSYIINTNKIEKISPLAERIYEIHFAGYEMSATMGRKKLEELLSKVDMPE